MMIYNVDKSPLLMVPRFYPAKIEPIGGLNPLTGQFYSVMHYKLGLNKT